MDDQIQIVAIVVTGGLFVLVFELVRRRRLMERYALLWLFASAVLLALAVWREGLLEARRRAIGIYYAPSALFAVAFGFILVLLLHFSLVISRLADQNKVLAQRVGLLQQRLDELGRGLGPRPRVATRELDAALTWAPAPRSPSVVVTHDSARRAARDARGAARPAARRRRAGRRRQRLRRRQRRASPAPPRASSRRATTSASPAAATPARGATAAPLLLFLNPDAVRRARAASTRCAPRRRAQPGWGAWQALVTLPGRRASTPGRRHALARLRLGGRLRRAGRRGRPGAARGRRSPRAPRSSCAARRGRPRAASTPRYFMYGEDLDLSLRLRLAGWGVGIVPGRARRARLRVRQGRLQVVPPRAQPLVDAARGYPRRCSRCSLPGAAGLRARAAAVAAARRLAAARSCARRPRCCARCRGRCAGAAPCRRRRGSAPRRFAGRAERLAGLAVPRRRSRGSRRCARPSARTGGSSGGGARLMHVGLDLLFLVPGVSGGRETYARELSAAMRERDDVTTFVNRETAAAGEGWWSRRRKTVLLRVRASAIGVAGRSASSSAPPAPRATPRSRSCIRPANFAPAHGPFARVLTLHDLIFRRLPGTVPRPCGRHGRGAAPAARRAHRVIAASADARATTVAEQARRANLTDHGDPARHRPAARGGAEAAGRAIRAAPPAGPRCRSRPTSRTRTSRGCCAGARSRAEERPLFVFAGFGTDVARCRASWPSSASRTTCGCSGAVGGGPGGAVRRPPRPRHPDPLRGLWAAGARGDGAWRARRVLRSARAARGRRRAAHVTRAGRPGGRRGRARPAPRPWRRRPRARRALHLGRQRRGRRQRR